MKIFKIVALLLLVQACGNSEDKIKNHLAIGGSYYQQGDYDKAKIEFKNVLELNAKHAGAYYHLALIDEKNQNWQGMFENLTKATEYNPKNNDAFLKLGRLALLSGHTDEALGHVEAALKNAAENPEALALKGAVLVKQGNLAGAMGLAEQALKQHPDQPDAISLKTAIYMAKQDIPSALATVEKALRTKPSDVSLLLLRLQVHQRDKNIAAVEQDYLEIIKHNPDKLEYGYGLAKHYSDNNQEDKATATLQALIDSHPDNMQPKLALVELQMQKHPELAEKSLADFLTKHPKEPDLHFQLASLYIKQNKLTEAKLSLNKVVELKPAAKEGLSAKIMLAKMAIQENDPDMASNYLTEVLSIDKGHPEGSLLKARLDLQKGLYDEVISNLNAVLRNNPDSVDALALIGQAHLNNNSPELADESFKKILAINPGNFDVLMPVISNLIKNKEAAKADELLLKVLNVIPDHPKALQALAQVRLLQKDWLGAQKVADAIATKPQGAGYSKFLSGKISEEQGLYKEATGQYKEALTLSPDLSDALHGMADSYEALKQREAMYAYLGEFMAAHPDNPYPWLLKSQLLMQDKRPDEAIDALSEAISKWPKVVEFHEALATSHLEKNDAGNAITVLNNGLQTSPNNIRLSIMLASAYQQTGEYAKALEVYETLIAKYPTVDLAVNNLVSLLLDHFNTKENIDRAVTLAKRFQRSDQPVFVDTYAWALINSGNSEEALNLLRNIVKKMPEAPVFRYHLGTAYHKTNSKALAITELEEAMKLGQQTGGFLEKEAASKLLKQIKGMR